MSELLNTLHTVKQRIDRYGSKGINEQDTKATLVQPVLRALNWDVEDLEDVQREYKIRKQDKPVDYGLFLLRTPCLFVEAKALGQNLDDRKWANQIMGYAGVAGVGWVVLTDGNEYRLYNSHATVPIEEKLFRTVSVAGDPPRAAETLQLLSKKRMQENEIDVLWKAHFVDRQVLAAVRDLFSSTPDPAVVRLVVKKVPSLSAKDIRASLQRASVSFDFPVKPSQVNQSSLTEPSSKRSARSKASARRRGLGEFGIRKSEVVPLLVREQILRSGTEIYANYKGHALMATVTPDGNVDFRGAVYNSPSAAGAAAKQSVAGQFIKTDGWKFWAYMNGDGVRVPLKAAKLAYLKRLRERKS
jgi:hypothetical protein